MRLFLLSMAVAVFSASATYCRKVACLKGTLNGGLDSSALFVRLTNGAWVFDSNPTTVIADFCVLAYSADCQISAYGWTPDLGLLPAPPGYCRLNRASTGNRVFCTCKDGSNWHMDFNKYIPLAQAKGVGACPVVNRPAHIPMPSTCF